MMPAPKRPEPRDLTVTASHKITENMHRITFGGPAMSAFPAGKAGGYVKLMLPRDDGSDRRNVRTYTIRNQTADSIDVDFALHGKQGGEAGPATEWALQANPGDTMKIGGPGPAKPLPIGADFYLIAGDMTALPAIGVNLEQLDAGARGLAVIEIQHENDRQPIACPPGVEIRWLVNPEPGTQPQLLAQALREAGWPQGHVYAWAACEFAAMRELREYLRGEHGLGPDQLYISSFWKYGLTEEAHKVAKREDAGA